MGILRFGGKTLGVLHEKRPYAQTEGDNDSKCKNWEVGVLPTKFSNYFYENAPGKMYFNLKWDFR